MVAHPKSPLSQKGVARRSRDGGFSRRIFPIYVSQSSPDGPRKRQGRPRVTARPKAPFRKRGWHGKAVTGDFLGGSSPYVSVKAPPMDPAKIRWFVQPPAGAFPEMERHQRSPGADAPGPRRALNPPAKTVPARQSSKSPPPPIRASHALAA